jgi:hypothetical protein
MPYRQPDGSFGPPYDKSQDGAVIPHEQPRFERPPLHVLPMLAYYRCDNHPGQVYHAQRRQWLTEDEDAYLRWKSHPWAEETTHADEESLADHMHGLGQRGIDFAPPNARRRSFLARELFAVLTDEDMAHIQIALDAEFSQAKSDKAGGGTPRTPLRLLWNSLTSAGEAQVDVTDVRFQAGWAGIRQALTPARATEIATALTIREPA